MGLGISGQNDGYIRVSIPLAGFNVSGGVKSLVGVANALAERGHRVRILAPDFAATPPTELHPSITLRIVPTGPNWAPASIRKLYHLVRLAVESTAGADVCLANYFTTAYAAWISRLIRGDGAVLAYNVRGYEPDSHGLLASASPPSRVAKWLLAWLSYRLPLHKICTTAWLRQKVGDRAAFVVGHGIDLDVFRPISGAAARDEIVVGTIAREGEAKGYPDFLRAIETLPPSLRMRFALAAPDPVVLRPERPVSVVRPMTEAEMAAFYASCDVFVFASRGEGFGLPPLEAMACGRAVVTTDCGGVREYARPDDNCLMVPPAAPARLAAAIIQLAEQPELRARLAKAGAETATAWSREIVLQRFCDYLVELARGHAATAQRLAVRSKVSRNRGA